jgi:hypothetical protein
MKNIQIATTLQGKGIEILGFDTCLQGSMENLWAVKRYSAANIVIASPNLIPGTGWDYNLFFSYLKNSYQRPYDFADAAIRAYRDKYLSYSNVSLLAYKVSEFDASVLSAFFSSLYIKRVEERDNFCRNAETFEKDTSSLPNLYYKNFYDFVNRSAIDNIPNKESVLAMLNKAIIYGWKKEHGNALDYKGINILGMKTSYDLSYNLIDFTADTNLTSNWATTMSTANWLSCTYQ